LIVSSALGAGAAQINGVAAGPANRRDGYHLVTE
jgi:hypothetical protein